MVTFGKECGWPLDHQRSRQPRARTSGRIIGGEESNEDAWPWQVSLQLLHPKFGFVGHWCGAVLIHQNWILSAAHCVHNEAFNLPLAALWTAVLGDWNRAVDNNFEQRIPVEKVVVHERFHHYQHDIVLMKLSRPANITRKSRVRLICLPNIYILYIITSECVATGWGRSRHSGELTDTLHQARVPLHDNSLCRRVYGKAVPIRPGHLCAGHLDGSSGTCVGDSGGPLQCRSPEGRWFLAGITSFGSGCARLGYPDVYTRTSHYTSWLRAKITEDRKLEEQEDDLL
ncbi:chymotrypsin-like elastase family member 2A [Ctenocephalides felis]|uniref:chymotrypsin-like elastase family member 2A n=1 Tax=Ctenocephalides felis TaxID=7515 RepID=UPI000E6E507F|nr:chymotrypsin-like elastase family member 2A [Ctenocephalides felis]